jgi:hypothetical protein
VKNSEKVSWRVDEIVPSGAAFDFSKNFLPAALSGARLPFLQEEEARKLNQITANAYINLFLFVEEYIIAQIVQHAHGELFGDHQALRALTRFADEELKHQQLFSRCLELFKRDFGSPCGVLGNAAVVAVVILEKSPIAVMLVTYHLEIMTQAHYTECIKNDATLDPLFVKLLRAHWIEESQHARIDALELDKLLSTSTPELLTEDFNDYLGLIDAFDGLLLEQARMDLVSAQTALQKTWSVEESEALILRQHKAYRQTFLIYGMTHPTFLEDLAKISQEHTKRVIEKAGALQAGNKN